MTINAKETSCRVLDYGRNENNGIAQRSQGRADSKLDDLDSILLQEEAERRDKGIERTRILTTGQGLGCVHALTNITHYII
jgi:hypothetical protein